MIKVLQRFYQNYSKVVEVPEISMPNPKLNVGFFNEYMGQMTQINYLIAEKGSTEISYSVEFEQESADRRGKGARYIPESADYYMGEGISWT